MGWGFGMAQLAGPQPLGWRGCGWRWLWLHNHFPPDHAPPTTTMHLPSPDPRWLPTPPLTRSNFWTTGTAFDQPLTRSYERLVRRLLGLPKRPALVFLNMFNWHDGWPFRCARVQAFKNGRGSAEP